jgi:NAD(P)-dependent dehydrogenase (short-subunit alcohol dehydrogenase family)
LNTKTAAQVLLKNFGVCIFNRQILKITNRQFNIKFMARIFITGSADGLGQLAAKALISYGHQVVLHARNEKRAEEALKNVPGAQMVLAADLSDINETKQLAEKVNALGNFDAVIHNAGVYHAASSEIFAVNTLAPYILTCLIEKPKRLIYLGSDLHLQGNFHPQDFIAGNNTTTYSDSKLHVLMLCKAVTRKFPDIFANALNPGWVPTKMGGAGAPDDLTKGYDTQVWLATSDDNKARASGKFFYHQKETEYNRVADDILLQDKLLSLCQAITGVDF